MIDCQKLFFFYIKIILRRGKRKKKSFDAAHIVLDGFLKPTEKRQRSSEFLSPPKLVFNSHNLTSPTHHRCHDSTQPQKEATPGKADQMKCSIMYHSRLCNLTSFCSHDFKVSRGK